jgi:hypothetical protein
MDYRVAVLKSFTRELEMMGLKEKAQRIKDSFNKQAQNSELSKIVSNINSLEKALGSKAKFIELYPVGSGQIPNREEIVVFYCGDKMEEVAWIKAEIEKSGLKFQSVQTLDFFRNTEASLSSKAMEQIDEDCFVITSTIEVDQENL